MTPATLSTFFENEEMLLKLDDPEIFPSSGYLIMNN